MKIKISYSWGEEEAIVSIPEEKDPWEYMKELAVNEAEAAYLDNEEYGPIGLEFRGTEIILTYNRSYMTNGIDQCHYDLIKETE